VPALRGTPRRQGSSSESCRVSGLVQLFTDLPRTSVDELFADAIGA
jgi:hypothetical protein